MKCEDCNKECWHFKSTSYLIDSFYQTKLYFRCPGCGTIYVETLIPQPASESNNIQVDHLEKYPFVEKCPKKNKVTLDKWM